MKELKPLELLTNCLIEPLRFSERVRGIRDVKLDTTVLERPYIANQLDYYISQMTPENAYILSAPVGSGKTRTIIQKIAKNAKKKNQNVLILTNRNPLNLAYAKEVVKITGMDDIYTEEGLQKATDFDNVFLVNYQGLATFLAHHKHLCFSYVIADEAHFFLQDAPFSDSTGYALDTICKQFGNSVRIYVSATIDSVLPYIIRAELPEIQIDSSGYAFWLNPADGQFVSVQNFMPKVFTMPSDYSRINLCFYDRTEELFEFLKSQNHKSMFFCNSIAECNKIKEALSSEVLSINAEFLKKNSEVLKKLVEKENFEEKILATTSVFSNGNNIKDKSVKAVAIELVDQTEILQMAGRRRVDYTAPNDGFALYVKIPDAKFLSKKFYETAHKMNLIEACEQNYNDVLCFKDRAIDDTEDIDAHFVASVYRRNMQKKKYELNYLTYEKLYADLWYFNYLHALITEEGPEAYCALVAELFGKTFHESMMFKTHANRVEELTNFIKKFNFPMNDEEFLAFAKNFQTKREALFGKCDKENKYRGDIPKKVAINRRLQELGIPYAINKRDELYYLEFIGDEDSTI